MLWTELGMLLDAKESLSGKDLQASDAATLVKYVEVLLLLNIRLKAMQAVQQKSTVVKCAFRTCTKDQLMPSIATLQDMSMNKVFHMLYRVMLRLISD